MQITNVRIKKADDSGKVKAFAIVTLGDCFAVHGIKVIEGVNGLFVAMPNRKDKEGNFVDVAHPVTAEFKKTLDEAVLEAFNAETTEA